MGRLKYTEEELENIKYDYLVNWDGIRTLSKKYKHSDNSIKKILIENGVQLRTHQESCKTRYKINENFFDIHNQNHNMAYIMGLIAADGMISSKDNMIKIELKNIDRKLLEEVNKILQNERDVMDYSRKKNGKVLTTSQLYFYSKKIKDDLSIYNIVPKKTYSSKFLFPDKLDQEFLISYIRGYFDGNGSIYRTTGHSSWQIDTPSESVAKGIIDYFKKYNIILNFNIEEKTNINLYRCITSKKENLKKIYEMFYNDISKENFLFLERKKEKFKSLL